VSLPRFSVSCSCKLWLRRFFRNILKFLGARKKAIIKEKPKLIANHTDSSSKSNTEDKNFKFVEDEGHEFAKAYKHNLITREKRFVEAIQNKQKWLLECCDLWDFYDSDAGIYFKSCENDHEVRHYINYSKDKNAYTATYGIFDTHQPLQKQAGGLTPEKWREIYGAEYLIWRTEENQFLLSLSEFPLTTFTNEIHLVDFEPIRAGHCFLLLSEAGKLLSTYGEPRYNALEDYAYIVDIHNVMGQQLIKIFYQDQYGHDPDPRIEIL
jgi:hypothetical protein